MNLHFFRDDRFVLLRRFTQRANLFHPSHSMTILIFYIIWVFFTFHLPCVFSIICFLLRAGDVCCGESIDSTDMLLCMARWQLLSAIEAIRENAGQWLLLAFCSVIPWHIFTYSLLSDGRISFNLRILPEVFRYHREGGVGESTLFELIAYSIVNRIHFRD